MSERGIYHSAQRVVGAESPEESAKIMQHLKDNVSDHTELVEGETEKTPEQLRTIDLANKLTNEIRARYGLEDVDISADRFFLVKEKKWRKLVRDKTIGSDSCHGLFNPPTQALVIRQQRSLMQFAHVVTHEMMHIKAYNAVQLTLDEGRLTDYRIGMRVVSRDGSSLYFNNLNEAITEALVKQALEKIFTIDPLFANEVKKTKSVTDDPAVKAAFGSTAGEVFYIDSDISLKEKFLGVSTENVWKRMGKFSYLKERTILSNLVRKLFERNRESFKDETEVFDLFARAAVAGNIFPIGKLVERTFGQGTFRRIGELDKNVDELQKFVESL